MTNKDPLLLLLSSSLHAPYPPPRPHALLESTCLRSAYKLSGKLLEILEAAQPPSADQCWIRKGPLLCGSASFCLGKETRTGVKLLDEHFQEAVTAAECSRPLQIHNLKLNPQGDAIRGWGSW